MSEEKDTSLFKDSIPLQSRDTINLGGTLFTGNVQRRGRRNLVEKAII